MIEEKMEIEKWDRMWNAIKKEIKPIQIGEIKSYYSYSNMPKKPYKQKLPCSNFYWTSNESNSRKSFYRN